MITIKTLGVIILAGVCIVASLVNLVRILQGQDADFYLQLIAFGGLGVIFITIDD